MVNGTNIATKPTLDHMSEIGVALSATEHGYTLTLDYPKLSSRRLTRQFTSGLSLSIGGREYRPSADQIHVSNDNNHIEYNIIAETAGTAQVKLFNEPVCTLHQSESGTGFTLQPEKAYERLTPDEIKMMANADKPLEGVPHSRVAMEGFDPQKHAPITDLHTHIAAQILPEDLMEIALKQDEKMDAPGITYPVELLKLLDPEGRIVTNDILQKSISVPPIEFNPGFDEELPLECERTPAEEHQCQAVRLQDLSPEARTLIVRKLTIAQTHILPYSDFDLQLYRFSNPLAKRTELTHDIILKIAQRYQENGVKCARISQSSMIKDPDGFAAMIRAADEAKKRYGVDIRFLAAIRRGSSPAEILDELHKVKYILKHPYVVGIDVFGYEDRDTGDISWALENVAQWVKNESLQNDVTIRVHVGEIDKRRGNVAACAAIAEKYGVRIDAAHALTGRNISPAEKTLFSCVVRHNLFGVELCASSNLAYNNISRMTDVPFCAWNALAPTFLGSDGCGALQTNATMLALGALAGGWTLSDLENLRQRETDLIDKQLKSEKAKWQRYRNQYPTDEAFIQGYRDHLDAVAVHSIDAELHGRLPLMIIGSGGETYNHALPIDPKKTTQLERNKNKQLRHEIAVAFEMLTLASDPPTTGFILGRVKKEGVSDEMDKALIEYQNNNGGMGFPVAGLNGKDTPDMAKSITYCQELPGQASSIPNSIFKIATKLHPPALPIFIGGSDFTRAILRKYTDDDVFEGGYPRLIMRNIPGASKDFSHAGATEDVCFDDGISLIRGIDLQVRSAKGRDYFGDRLPFPETLYKLDEAGQLALNDQLLEQLKERAEINVNKRENAVLKTERAH